MKAARLFQLPQERSRSRTQSAQAYPVGEERPRGNATAVALLILSACASVAACAAAPPYNPFRLSADQLSQVGEVCESTMGFRPSGALTDSLWPGNPDPATSSNSYRGCVATLSISLKETATARASRQAERECVSKGFATSSSDLALCVLMADEVPAPANDTRLASTTVKPFLVSTEPAYSGHVPSGVPKEKLACAEIGLNPNEDAFSACVRSLKSVEWAPFFDDGYRN
jgi:hypothetical protein